MSGQHTPEPWRVDPCFSRDIQTADGKIDICATECSGSQWAKGYETVSCMEDAAANARRIVACVNACAGCATEILEAAPVGFFDSTYGHPRYLSELEKQRDELMAALQKIASKCNLDMHGDDGSLGGYAFGIWQTANAAIANIKESK